MILLLIGLMLSLNAATVLLLLPHDLVLMCCKIFSSLSYDCSIAVYDSKIESC